jgi:drug/metabolite transporter (DMT)-like permease
MLFLGQNPTAIDLAGTLLVLAGVAIQEREVTGAGREGAERQQRGAGAT